MSEAIPNTFTTYLLSEKDALQSSIFTSLQLQNLQNQRAIAAEEKIRLVFDATNPVFFAQEEASLKGKIDILTILIDDSAAAVDELNNPEYNPNI